MIITRTPYRVSFFGGGTDLKGWYGDHGGECLSATLHNYCYISLRKMPPFLGSKYRVFWSKAEEVNAIEDIEHPGVRGCLQYLGINDGIEVNHAGDLPARSGLGSSSAFTVGMLHALREMDNIQVSSHQLALEAIAVEQNVLKETVGIQDQIACTYGGLNHIKINPDSSFDVIPIRLSLDVIKNLEHRLLLFFTGIQRYSSEIQKDQVENTSSKGFQLQAIQNMVSPAIDALLTGDLDRFGSMLHDTWMLKRELSPKISNPTIEEIYSRAIDAGATGGKVLGAGGGGFMLFYTIDPDKLRLEMSDMGLMEWPFKFSNNGSQIMVNSL